MDITNKIIIISIKNCKPKILQFFIVFIYQKEKPSLPHESFRVAFFSKQFLKIFYLYKTKFKIIPQKQNINLKI